MFKNIAFYLLALSLILICLWFVTETYYFFTHSREQIIFHYLQNNPNIYKPSVFKEFYFTENTYKQALWFVSLAVGVGGMLNIVYWKYRNFCKKLCQNAVQLCIGHFFQFRKYVLACSKGQIILLVFAFLSILVHQIYTYQHIFVAMDEAFSWLFFASQGSFVTLTHYPVPNNHIFYNLCSLFWSNFIGDEILAMRLTSIIAFWILLLLIFYYFLKTTNFQTALFALMLVGLGFSQSVFAVQGRGYMLVALCFFVALWSLQTYLNNQNKGYLVFFTLACVIGFWTIPVFLYVFVSLYAYLIFAVWRKTIPKKVFIDFFKAGLIIGGIVYLCYCPVLMYSGFSALAGNENVSSKTYDTAWFFGYILSIALRESVIYVMSLPKYTSFAVFAILAIAFWQMYRKSKNLHFRFLWEFLLVSLVVTFAVICLMRAFPFYRVWTYYAIFLAILLAWLFDWLFSVLKNKWFCAFRCFERSRNVQKTYFKYPLVWLISLNGLLAVGSYFQFWREIQDFYDLKAYEHHKNLTEASMDIIRKQQNVYLTVEAFYVKFWLEYTGNTHLLRQNSCKADVAVSKGSEAVPVCQEADREIWFLRSHHHKN